MQDPYNCLKNIIYTDRITVGVSLAKKSPRKEETNLLWMNLKYSKIVMLFK